MHRASDERVEASGGLPLAARPYIAQSLGLRAAERFRNRIRFHVELRLSRRRRQRLQQTVVGHCEPTALERREHRVRRAASGQHLTRRDHDAAGIALKRDARRATLRFRFGVAALLVERILGVTRHRVGAVRAREAHDRGRVRAEASHRADQQRNVESTQRSRQRGQRPQHECAPIRTDAVRGHLRRRAQIHADRGTAFARGRQGWIVVGAQIVAEPDQRASGRLRRFHSPRRNPAAGGCGSR